MSEVKRIFEYSFDVVDAFTLTMPKGAEILCCQIQRDFPYIWALVTPDAQVESRHFVVIGTGHPITTEEHDGLKYIGTFQMYNGKFVGHLFEATKV